MFKCSKCGQGGLQTVTYINGIPVCSYCLPPVVEAPGFYQDYSFSLGMISQQLKEIKEMLQSIKEKENV
jgi:hypothetical protein